MPHPEHLPKFLQPSTDALAPWWDRTVAVTGRFGPVLPRLSGALRPGPGAGPQSGRD